MEDPAALMENAVGADGFEFLLQRIARARPDLRDKIAERFGVPAEPQGRFDMTSR